jgi:hypothetical protein
MLWRNSRLGHVIWWTSSRSAETLTGSTTLRRIVNRKKRDWYSMSNCKGRSQPSIAYMTACLHLPQNGERHPQPLLSQLTRRIPNPTPPRRSALPSNRPQRPPSHAHIQICCQNPLGEAKSRQEDKVYAKNFSVEGPRKVFPSLLRPSLRPQNLKMSLQETSQQTLQQRVLEAFRV